HELFEFGVTHFTLAVFYCFTDALLCLPSPTSPRRGGQHKGSAVQVEPRAFHPWRGGISKATVQELSLNLYLIDNRHGFPRSERREIVTPISRPTVIRGLDGCGSSP